MSIWEYKDLKSQFSEHTKLITLGEGKTPVDKFNSGSLYLIREDQNPTGSWKDRGTAFKLTQLISQQITEVVLFSSGNALISLLTYCNKLMLPIKVNAVVSENINREKLELITELTKNTTHELFISSSPKKESIRIAAQKRIPNLRVSIDNDILKGYWSLGFQIYSLIKNTNTSNTSIYIPASSGTAVVGLVEGLFSKIENETRMPKVFICQTQSVNTFVQNPKEILEKSFADAIIDTVGLRTSQIQKIARETGGDTFAVTNDELINSKKYLESMGIDNLSYNSLLSVAGYLRANNNSEKHICIASGR
jgi:threonine synthase